MRKTLMPALLLLLALNAPLAAKKAKPTPEATLAPTPEAAPRYDDVVTLKDGQSSKGQLGSYDSYFLHFTLPNGTGVDLPMKEIAEIKPAETSGDMALIQQYLTRDPMPVTAVIAPKDPGEALKLSLLQGFFIHGYGHKYAGDQDVFLALAGAELFGFLVGGFGTIRQIDPAATVQDKEFSSYLIWGGGGFFALSWLVDVAFAHSAAVRFNRDHKLAALVAPYADGARLALSARF